MSQTPAAAPLAPMSPNAVMTAFHYVQSLQEGDTETAGMLANAEPRLLTLLLVRQPCLSRFQNRRVVEETGSSRGLCPGPCRTPGRGPQRCT